jgi:hypothetical protein
MSYVRFGTKRTSLAGRLMSFDRGAALMGYGVDFTAMFRHATVFVDKILKGADPADIPIEPPTRTAAASARSCRWRGAVLDTRIALPSGVRGDYGRNCAAEPSATTNV